MSAMLEIDGQLIPVECESDADYDLTEPSSVTTMMDGSRFAPRAARPAMDWTLSWDVASPDQYATLMALAAGEFGRGSYRLVDSTAAATNVLSRDVSVLGPFVDLEFTSISVSGLVQLAGGGVAGRSLTVLASGVSMTPGMMFAGMSPGGGEWVTASVFATASSGTGVRIRPVWYTADGGSVDGPQATVEAPTFGPLGRVSTSVQVPAQVTPAGGVPGPVLRVGIKVFDVSRVARPAISWTPEVTEWGVGMSPRFVRLFPPSMSTILAIKEQKGLRSSSVQVRVQEVGAP